MLKTVDYTNHSTKIFEGFYESNLYNSDSEYHFNEMMQDEENQTQYELKDFDGFCNEVGKKAAELLHEALVFEKSIIQSIDFESLWSPKYYNFQTDKLNLKIKLNQRKLELYCFRQEKTAFNSYLKNNFTSYDGFTSFIENNINDFKDQYIEEGKKDRTLNVMIEFYILKNLDKDSYFYDLCEAANEILFDYMEAIED